VSFYALLLYTHNRPVIKCSTEYTKPERSLRRGARSKIRSLLQKDSTRRGHLKVREREIYLREKSSSFTAVVIVVAWPHLVCDGRALTRTRARELGRRRHRTSRWTFLVVIVVCLRPFCS
jgi:hypothetical protein